MIKPKQTDKNMAELDVLSIQNPTSEDFTWRYNGEPYTILAGETKTFSKHVAFHLAKHLSDEIIIVENPSKLPKNATEKDRQRDEVRIAQLCVFDNPKRRIALYRIIKDPILVQDCLASYPFKAFVGDMEEYRNYVIKDKGEFIDRKQDDKPTMESLAAQIKELQAKLSEGPKKV